LAPAELRRPYRDGARIGASLAAQASGWRAGRGGCGADSTLTCFWSDGDPAAGVTAPQDIRAVVSGGRVVTPLGCRPAR
jgi:hypothetical protein